MNGISKLVLLIGAALTGILAIFIGNNPFSSPTPTPADPVTTITNGNEIRNYPPKNTPTAPSKIDLSDILPSQVLGDQLVTHNYFALSYASDYQNAEWAVYELHAAWLNETDREERRSFKADPLVQHEAKISSYTNSGYDRGHLVPAYDMAFDEAAMDECFYMSNVCPQDPDFNRGIWKDLENLTRNCARQYDLLYVVTGPLLRKKINQEERLPHDGASIPRGFYKILVAPQQGRAIAFMFKNKATDRSLEEFTTTIDKVEEYTGIDFFPNWSEKEQEILETQQQPLHWRL